VWSGENHEQSRLRIIPLAWITIDKFITIQKIPCHRRFKDVNETFKRGIVHIQSLLARNIIRIQKEEKWFESIDYYHVLRSLNEKVDRLDNESCQMEKGVMKHIKGNNKKTNPLMNKNNYYLYGQKCFEVTSYEDSWKQNWFNGGKHVRLWSLGFKM